MSKERVVLIIPGLSDRIWLTVSAKDKFLRLGFTPSVYSAHWKSEENLQTKLDNLLQTICDLKAEGHKISLIGTSAGASLALNAFMERKGQINRVINVCGRLSSGFCVNPSLDTASKGFLEFRQSVERFEQLEPKMTKEQRDQILIVKPWFDERVPLPTMNLVGAHATTIPSFKHMLSIGLALNIFTSRLVNFLED